MKKLSFTLLIYFLFISLTMSQDISYDIPEGYEADISKKEYKFLVKQSLKEIKKNFKVVSIKSGAVTLEEGQPYSIINLHNLILKCKSLDKNTRKEIIEDHFASMAATTKVQEELDHTNFDSMKKYLAIRIYETSFVENAGGTEHLVSREDLEGTTSLVVLDLPTTFSPIQKELLTIWKKSKEEVFKIAQSNVNTQEFTKTTQEFDVNGNTIKLYFIENENYGASLALDLEKNVPEFIGDWGAAVAIPNKGIVNFCKISKDNPLDFVLFIQSLKPVVEQFYNEHPQKISKDFYWFYQGTYTKIEVIDDGTSVNVVAPLKLAKLMSKE